MWGESLEYACVAGEHRIAGWGGRLDFLESPEFVVFPDFMENPEFAVVPEVPKQIEKYCFSKIFENLEFAWLTYSDSDPNRSYGPDGVFEVVRISKLMYASMRTVNLHMWNACVHGF